MRCLLAGGQRGVGHEPCATMGVRGGSKEVSLPPLGPTVGNAWVDAPQVVPRPPLDCRCVGTSCERSQRTKKRRRHRSPAPWSSCCESPRNKSTSQRSRLALHGRGKRCNSFLLNTQMEPMSAAMDKLDATDYGVLIKADYLVPSKCSEGAHLLPLPRVPCTPQ